MDLLSYYLEKHEIKNWEQSMKSSGANQMGSMYNFYNTNFRSLNRYNKAVNDFLPYAGVPREDWPKQKSGQEKFKHYVTFLTSTKLFRLYEGAYYLTERGRVLLKVFEEGFNEYEVWILTYILFLDAYYDKTPNYFIESTKMIINELPKTIEKEKIIDSFKEFLLEFENNRNRRFFQDALFYHAFYADKELLSMFFKSSEREKMCLKEYVSNNYLNKSYSDVISYKLKPNGSVQFRTVYDDILTFYLTNFIIDKMPYESINQVIGALLLEYKNIFKSTRVNKIKEFLKTNKNVFEIIYINLDINKENQGNVTSDYDVSEINKILRGPESWIDSTTLEGINKINSIFEKRKEIAREAAEYKCFFEDIEMCKYFTSRSSDYNYVEVHHMLPREFRNDFEYSIEVLENYVVLCPNCHKKIHLANNKERLHLLNYMYNQRVDALKLKGLYIDFDNLLEMYRCNK